MPKRILHDREQLRVIAGLREQHLFGGETGLFDPRGVEIEPSQRPQHRRRRARASREPRHEQGRRGIFRQRRRAGRHFVQGTKREPAGGQPTIDRVDIERQHRARARGRVERGDPAAQLGEMIEASTIFHRES